MFFLSDALFKNLIINVIFFFTYLAAHSPLHLSLQVPVLQNNNGPPLVGLVTIACHLVKEAKHPELLGDTAESRAVVQQWLEYRVTKLDNYTKEDIKIILKVKKITYMSILSFHRSIFLISFEERVTSFRKCHNISVSVTFAYSGHQLVIVCVFALLKQKRQEYKLMYGPSVTWPRATKKKALMCLTPVSVKWIVSHWSAGRKAPLGTVLSA